jgi:hypothetical protein
MLDTPDAYPFRHTTLPVPGGAIYAFFPHGIAPDTRPVQYVFVPDPAAWPPPPRDHDDPRINLILAALQSLLQKVSQMSAQMDALTAEVAATKGVIESAVTVIRGIAARIEAAGTDPAALAALTADLHASESSLADAVASDAQPVPIA